MHPQSEMCPCYPIRPPCPFNMTRNQDASTSRNPFPGCYFTISYLLPLHLGSLTLLARVGFVAISTDHDGSTWCSRPSVDLSSRTFATQDRRQRSHLHQCLVLFLHTRPPRSKNVLVELLPVPARQCPPIPHPREAVIAMAVIRRRRTGWNNKQFSTRRQLDICTSCFASGICYIQSRFIEHPGSSKLFGSRALPQKTALLDVHGTLNPGNSFGITFELVDELGELAHVDTNTDTSLSSKYKNVLLGPEFDTIREARSRLTTSMFPPDLHLFIYRRALTVVLTVAPTVIESGNVIGIATEELAAADGITTTEAAEEIEEIAK